MKRNENLSYRLIFHNTPQADDHILFVPREVHHHHEVGLLQSQVGEVEHALKQDISLPHPLMETGKVLKVTSSVSTTVYSSPDTMLATNLICP